MTASNGGDQACKHHFYPCCCIHSVCCQSLGSPSSQNPGRTYSRATVRGPQVWLTLLKESKQHCSLVPGRSSAYNMADRILPTIPICYITFIFVCGGTVGNIQGLILALHTGIPISRAREQTQVSTC